MPAGNGTGPSGFGPMTGRGAGYCTGNSAPGYTNPTRRGGFFRYGRGRGGGRGWRNQFYATGQPFWARGRMPYPTDYGYGFGYTAPEFTKETEVNLLKEQADLMQKEVSAIHERIKELENLASGQKDKS